MTSINGLLADYVAELRDGDVPDPLHQTFSLALVWCDLCRLAGEPLPAEVAAAVDAQDRRPLPVARWLDPSPPRRGSFLDHAAQFPELGDDLTIVDVLRRCPHTVA